MINYSIIIPHYNSFDSLCRLLESIGFHDDVEVLVIDDKSTQIIDENYFSLRHNTFFMRNTTVSKGAGTCRNIGLSVASGRWVIFADSDDLFTNDWYKTVETTIDNESDIVYFIPSGDGTNRHCPFERLVSNYIAKKKYSELKLRIQFNPPWSKVYRKDFLTSRGIFFEEVLYSNDVMFSMKAGFYARNITAVSKPFYILIEAPQSLTKNKSFDSFRIRNLVNCRAYVFLKNNLATKSLKHTYILKVPIATIIQTIKRGYGFAACSTIIKDYKEYGFPIFKVPLFQHLIDKLMKR